MKIDLKKALLSLIFCMNILICWTINGDGLRGYFVFDTNAENPKVAVSKLNYKRNKQKIEKELSEIEAQKVAKYELTEKTTEKIKEREERKAKLEQNIIEDENFKDYEVEYLGEFVLTAYCPCAECCGEYGISRPLDENGDPIIYTASGARAEAGNTIAVDPDVIPYGSKVIIDINGEKRIFTAQDTGGAIRENSIDVYFDTHEDAWDFGYKHGNIFLVKNG